MGNKKAGHDGQHVNFEVPWLMATSGVHRSLGIICESVQKVWSLASLMRIRIGYLSRDVSQLSDGMKELEEELEIADER
jgi:hypothetical protein